MTALGLTSFPKTSGSRGLHVFVPLRAGPDVDEVPAFAEAVVRHIAPRQPETPEADLRRAVVLIAVGLGLCGLGYGMWYGLMSVSDIAAYITGGSIAGAGAIPGLIGIAHLLLWASRRGRPKA